MVKFPAYNIKIAFILFNYRLKKEEFLTTEEHRVSRVISKIYIKKKETCRVANALEVMDSAEKAVLKYNKSRSGKLYSLEEVKKKLKDVHPGKKLRYT